jgi:hypothetical protein
LRGKIGTLQTSFCGLKGKVRGALLRIGVVAAENTCFLADHQLGRFWELIQRLIVDRTFR